MWDIYSSECHNDTHMEKLFRFSSVKLNPEHLKPLQYEQSWATLTTHIVNIQSPFVLFQFPFYGMLAQWCQRCGTFFVALILGPFFFFLSGVIQIPETVISVDLPEHTQLRRYLNFNCATKTFYGIYLKPPTLSVGVLDWTWTIKLKLYLFITLENRDA